MNPAHTDEGLGVRPSIVATYRESALIAPHAERRRGVAAWQAPPGWIPVMPEEQKTSEAHWSGAAAPAS